MRYFVFVILAGLLISGCQPLLVPGKEPPPPLASTDVKAAREAGWPVAVSKLTGLRDSSNDITVRFILTNVSDKTIRHLYVTAYLRSEAGDPLLDDMSRSIYKELEYAGPVRPGELRWGENSEIPKAFRQAAAATVHVRDLRAVFSDGTETPVIRVEGQEPFAGPVKNVLP